MQRITLFVAALCAFLLLSGFGFYENYRLHYSSGPDPGYSGDAANGFQTCASCHVGSSTLTLNSVITSDIPSSGYLPNTTYTIFVSVKADNITRYGFQVSPQNTNGQFLGKLVVTDENKTQLNPDNEHYINHSFKGIDFPAGAAAWSFQWISPAAGSGDVTFYGAFLLSNKSNSSNGDQVAKSTLFVPENGLTSFETKTLKNNAFSLNIFPNPVSEQLRYSIELKESTHLTISILQSDGKIVHSSSLKNLAPQKHDLSIPVSQLPKGLYHLQLDANGKKTAKSFWVE